MIIIINLFFKTFFLKLCLYDEFDFIHIFGARHISKGKLALAVSLLPTKPFSWGSSPRDENLRHF